MCLEVAGGVLEETGAIVPEDVASIGSGNSLAEGEGERRKEGMGRGGEEEEEEGGGICTVGIKKKFPFPFRSVPFCYGKTGDFFPSRLARSVPFRSVPFRSVRLACFRAHVYKFYISRDRPIDRSSAKRQPSFQVA